MQKFIIPVCVALAAFAFTQPTLARNNSKPMTAQQSKFAACAHQSKGIKGEAHKKFMSDCLKGKSEAASSKVETKAAASAGEAKTMKEGAKGKAHSQREKMKSCNADAKSKKLKGKARRTFMSECLKGG